MYDHFNTPGHTTTLEYFSIVGRNDQNIMMIIKESIYIGVNNPSLNQNISKYYLPYIWDKVLFNISELKIKWNKIKQDKQITQWSFHLQQRQYHLP